MEFNYLGSFVWLIKEFSSCTTSCLPNDCLSSQEAVVYQKLSFTSPPLSFVPEIRSLFLEQPNSQGKKITFQVHIGSCNTWMDGWMDRTHTDIHIHTHSHPYWHTHTHTSAMQIWGKEVGSHQVGTGFPWHSIRCSGLHATPHTATSLPSRPPPEHGDDSWSQCSSCCQSLPVASVCGTLGKRCWGRQRGRWAGHRCWCGPCLGGCFRVAMSTLNRMRL